MIEVVMPVILAVIAVLCTILWYRVVPPSQAHLVVTPRKKMTCSPDPNVQKHGGGCWYFAIPSWVPFFGRSVRIMTVTVQELRGEMETYESGQARYNVTYSLKYRVNNVEVAAEAFVQDSELKEQLVEIVQAATRATTVKHPVQEARANKKKMSDDVMSEIQDDLGQYGLTLVNFVLVEFKDTQESKIISNISKRREVEVEAETRELNAERLKKARVKEAEAEENAKKREIERDEVIARREQDKTKAVAVSQKEARDKELEVTKLEQVKGAQIEKEKQIVEANQRKEVEEINKEQQKLKGEGEKAYLEEKAKGDAAKTREQGFADAEAKMKLQEALNKFQPNAINALVAEKVVAMQQEVGIKSAEALAKADLRIFSGSGECKAGFDVSQLVTALAVGNESAAKSLLNRFARPNDLGIGPIFGDGEGGEQPKPDIRPPLPSPKTNAGDRKAGRGPATA